MGQLSQTFVPYANESDVLNIGHLTIENRVDRVTLCGDVDLTADQAGLADARVLHRLLGDIVARLEAMALPATLPAPATRTVDNPFE
ncbi:hypothetical protein SAMN05428959_103184 [Duganella sp. CF517]|uniref:hypothetical protein n=1 Tax=Duganella sp. CF517 TaxID=1881038 RepID=UPI0008CD2554|nr:hypothetical protein [Duganella sp. CF517]SEN79995.1 hypothetical protein SAMN05428959_103184 [Duganella sp. CF517]